jgi:hypothetical protein
MNLHNEGSARIFVFMLGMVFFLFGAVAWFLPAPAEPYRIRCVSAGLFCWALSTILT